MADQFPFPSSSPMPGTAPSGRPPHPASSAPARVGSGDEVQVVPVAPSAGRRPGMLRPPRRAADGGHHRFRSRGLVPGLRVLQAPPHAEEAQPRRLPLLILRLERTPIRQRDNSFASAPTRPAARAVDTRASAGARPATAPSSRRSPRDRSARPRRRDSAAAPPHNTTAPRRSGRGRDRCCRG